MGEMIRGYILAGKSESDNLGELDVDGRIILELPK
jgi:hypothetical protein